MISRLRFSWSWIMWLWVLFLSVAYSVMIVVRHNNYLTNDADLAQYDQAIWQFSQGIWPFNSLYGRFIWGDHLALLLPVISLLYRFWDDVRIVLIFQAFFITLSSLAVFRLGLIRKFSGYVSFCVAVAYSMFYGVQYAVYLGFNPIITGVALLPWLAYFLESERRRLFWITLVLALAAQENMGVAVASVGIFYLFQAKYRASAWVLIVIGAAYTLLSMRIIGYLSPVGYEYQPSLGETLWASAAMLFDYPEKQHVWFLTFASFAFVPFFSLASVLAITLDLAQFFVAGSGYQWMRQVGMYHRAILAIFVTLGTLDVLGRYRKYPRALVIIASGIVGATLICSIVGQFPLVSFWSQDVWKKRDWIQDANRLFARIPPDESLATQINFAAHLSHRNEIYIARVVQKNYDSCRNKQCVTFDIPGNPTYFVAMRNPDSQDEHSRAVDALEKEGRIIPVDREGNVIKYLIK